MTTREFYLSVINGTVDADSVAKAQELLIALDNRNEKRKSVDSKAKRESADRREIVLSALSSDPIFADTIAEDHDLSVGQVRSALSALVREGKADKVAVKVEKTKKMAYTLHIGE